MDVGDCVVPARPNSATGKKNEESVAADIENSTSAADSDMSNREEEEDYCSHDGYDDDYTYADDDDNYDKRQSQFDNLDFPPGVETSIPWMVSAASRTGQSAASSSLSTIALHSGATSTSGQMHKPKEVAASGLTLSD